MCIRDRYNASCFYAHQAAEKAAKALLYSVNEAPWGHSVRLLLERFFARKREKYDENLLSLARELDRHYIPSRYPNAHPEGTPHEAYDVNASKGALNAATKIVDLAKEVLKWKPG